MRRWKTLCVILALVLLAGCSSDEKKNAETSTADSGSQQAAAPPAGMVDSGMSQEVKIHPEHPTSSEPLLLVRRIRATGSRVSWLVNGTPVEGAFGERLMPGTYRRGDQVTVQVDLDGNVSEASVTIGNGAPVVNGVNLTETNLGAGKNIAITIDGADPDDDLLTYNVRWLVNGEEADPLSDTLLPGAILKRGDRVMVEVTPQDGLEEGETFRSKELVIPNSAPRISSNPPSGLGAAGFVYQVQAADPDGDSLSYSLEQGPEGATIDAASGLVTWPLDSMSAGTHTIAVTVQDSEGASTTQQFELTYQPAG